MKTDSYLQALQTSGFTALFLHESEFGWAVVSFEVYIFILG